MMEENTRVTKFIFSVKAYWGASNRSFVNLLWDYTNGLKIRMAIKIIIFTFKMYLLGLGGSDSVTRRQVYCGDSRKE